MTVKAKLVIFLVISMTICASLVIVVDRLVAATEIRAIVQEDLEDLVATAVGLVEAHPGFTPAELSPLFDKELSIGRTGFLFVVSGEGDLVVHKKAQGENWLDEPFIAHIVEQKSGYHRYISPKTGTFKVAAFRYYAPEDWIIVASNFEDDSLAQPLQSMLLRSLAILVPALTLLTIGFVVFLGRAVVRPIKVAVTGLGRGSAQVAIASDQISTSSQRLAEGASEQAASIEETASSVEEMSSIIRQNSDNAIQADAVMVEVVNLVTTANQAMQRLTTSMAELTEASRETSTIVGTIDQIAFQTNVLALNAAVEAARAGSAGRGFAVVADEVRSLAQRAAEAAKSTSSRIEETLDKIGVGDALVETVNEAFRDVTAATKEISQLISEIASASKEQATGIGQITIALSTIDTIVQTNAANAEENASAAEEMYTQLEEMEEVVGGLDAMISHQGDRPAKG